MTVAVHITNQPEPHNLDILQTHLDPSVTLTFGKEVPETAVYQIIIDDAPSDELLSASPNLTALINPWTGISGATRERMMNYPHISVHNLHFNDIPVAEIAFMLLIAAAKQAVSFDQSLRQNDWTPRYTRKNDTILLYGKTALILGYGAIGRHVGQMCHGTGMKVIGTRRSVDEMVMDGKTAVYPTSQLHDLLPQANALIICLPLTAETKHMIRMAEIELLPPKPLFVNIGRGKVVEEAALYDALKTKRIHAAGLDVWYNYPDDEPTWTNTPPANFPFHELDNVVMSPHRATFTADSEALQMKDFARLINTAVHGDPMPNRVDLAAGY